MIDEEKLIERIKQEPTDGMYTHEIIEAIEEQPKIGVWIPCSERLPEKEVPVLCQWNKRNGLDTEVYYNILHVDDDGGWSADYGMPNGEVVAWQPLPEPYKEVTSNE